MILIADDNTEVRRILRSMLEDIDPDIIECANGHDAIENYCLHEPDVVLMDLNMTPVDGLTAPEINERAERWIEAEVARIRGLPPPVAGACAAPGAGRSAAGTAARHVAGE